MSWLIAAFFTTQSPTFSCTNESWELTVERPDSHEQTFSVKFPELGAAKCERIPLNEPMNDTIIPIAQCQGETYDVRLEFGGFLNMLTAKVHFDKSFELYLICDSNELDR